MLQPAELCTKTGEVGMELLRNKHPDARPPDKASFDTYPDRQPELVSLDTTKKMVMEVAGRLSAGAGLGGGLSEPPALVPAFKS